MRNTQEKFTTALEEIVTDAGLELVVDSKWSNTGTFRVQPKDGFASVLTMSYSFQDGYASFDEVTPSIGDRQKTHPRGPDSSHFPYVTPDELESRVLSAVRKHLTGKA